MAKCRFFPECARCNEVGDSWFPCEGGADGTRCADYAPMPDVEALLALADEIERTAGFDTGIDPRVLLSFARRIREACGEEAKDEA